MSSAIMNNVSSPPVYDFANPNSELTVIPLMNVSHHHNHHHNKHSHTSLCSSSQMEITVVKVMLLGLITMTALLAFAETGVEARPSRNGWPEYSRSLLHSEYHRRTANECDLNSGVRELCQRCAKATKSTWAYPLCCDGKENTINFCRNFLDFSSYSSAQPAPPVI